uniref:Uncharacterized protein n=1 Tax=Panagrolaimus sp. ES5 TaxID=591445 RepID=A0AC34GNQ7_9BILA
MDTNSNFQGSKKRKYPSYISESGDGENEAQFEAMKVENTKLKNELKSKEAAIINLATIMPGLNQTEEEMEKFKENKVELEAEIEEMEAKMEEEKLKYENRIVQLKSTIEAFHEIIVSRDVAINKLQQQLLLATQNNENDFDTKMTFLTTMMNAKEADARKRIKERDNECNRMRLLVSDLTQKNSELIQKEQKFAAEYEQKYKQIETEQQLFCDELEKYKENMTEFKESFKKYKNERNDFRYLSVEDIHDGPEILYDRLGYGTILNVEKLESVFTINSWKLYSTETSEAFQININESFKRTRFDFNLTGSVIVNHYNKDTCETIIHRIHSSNITKLELGSQLLGEFDYKKLVTAPEQIKSLKFLQVSIKKPKEIFNNGSKFFSEEFMRIDEILKDLSNIEDFYYCFRYCNDVNSQTAKYLAKLPCFKKLKTFQLHNCSPAFDLEAFGEFVQKHENAHFDIHYRPLIESTKAEIKKTLAKMTWLSTCRLQVHVN